MVAHASARIHRTHSAHLRRGLRFGNASQRVVGRRCSELRSDPKWNGIDVDKVGDAVLRPLSMHFPNREATH
jgi:hypothetical protein